MMILLPKFKAFAAACLMTISCVALKAHSFDPPITAVVQNHETILEKYFSEPTTGIETIETTLNEGVKNRNAYFPNLHNFMTHFLRYPSAARDKAIEGTVKVEIGISPEGDITSATIVEKLGYGCDETVLELVKHMPRWIPRLRKGIATAQTLILPVTFKLAD